MRFKAANESAAVGETPSLNKAVKGLRVALAERVFMLLMPLLLLMLLLLLMMMMSMLMLLKLLLLLLLLLLQQ